MNKTKLNKAVALFCLTGFIFGGGTIVHAEDQSTPDNTTPATEKGISKSALTSAIMGLLQNIPIPGSTSSYTFSTTPITGNPQGYSVCNVSNKDPEVTENQKATCIVHVPGGWAVPPILTKKSNQYQVGGEETLELKAGTFRWHGGRHPWMEVGLINVTVDSEVYQGTNGLSGGGLWGNGSWGDNQWGWGGSGSSDENGKRNTLSSKTHYADPKNDTYNFTPSKNMMNDRTGALDLSGGKGTLKWGDSSFKGGSGSSFNGGGGGGSFGDLINDALNDRGGSFSSNGKTRSYSPNNASFNDWNSSKGDDSGNKNLDGYFNGNSYWGGSDTPTNMPNGLTNDLFGFDTTPTTPPSWFDSKNFLDESGNIKADIANQMSNSDFWLNGKEPGTINGQQMWDFYESAVGMGELAGGGGGLFDQNGNPIEGFYDINGNPISVFFDENGNFIDANGNPIKVYDRYGNEITGLFDRYGKPIGKSLFYDVNGDGVIDIRDLIQQLAEKESLLSKMSGEDALQSILNSIFGDDSSLNKTTQETLSIQDMYSIAKQLLLNSGFDIDDIMNGRNYSNGSAYTDPTDSWDFNRITTLMRARKITPVTPDEIREHQENRRKALTKKGIGGFGMPLTDPSIEQVTQ